MIFASGRSPRLSSANAQVRLPPVCRMREAREGAGGCVLRVGARHCLLTLLDGGGRVRVRVGVFCGLARAIACSLS